MDAVAKIARTVLYEGYILWPYRRSALKNRQRWTFGGVYPRAHADRRGGDDPWIMQTQALLEADDDARVDVVVRFLHLVERRVAEERAGALVFVDELAVGAERLLAWDEAAEREVGATLGVPELRRGRALPVEIAPGRAEEWVVDPASGGAGVVVRRWEPLQGAVRLGAERLRERLLRVTVRIENTTPCDDGPREAALRRTFASTHTVLRAGGGDFVSLTDPPAALRAEAATCRNLGTWPVLAGAEGERHTLLSSPIILPDYPAVAPESPGDLFDGGEIDQLLVLNILGLTDEERREMRATDPRAREILERCEALTPEQLLRLRGEIRPRPWEA